MALWTCGACTAAYSVGAPACPHCGGTEYQEDAMPKISAGAGPTSALGQDPDAPAFPGLAEPPPASARKADWVDHAVATGVPPEQAEAMTKAELVESASPAEDTPAG